MIFRSPFTAIVSGATGSGKSSWVKRFIENRHSIIYPPPACTLYCYGEMNPTILEHKNNGIEIFEGIPEKQYLNSKPKNLLLIIDDLMLDINANYLNELFTRISHNSNISVVLILQSLYAANTKVARQNTHYFVLMRNPQGHNSIRTLGSQIFPGKLGYFLEAFNDATSKLFSYLVLDTHPSTAENERLVTNIFPNELTTYYLPQ